MNDAPDSHLPADRPHWFKVWGWVVLLGILVGIAVPAWQVLVVRGGISEGIGDGVNIDSYQFDLSNLAVPRAYVAARRMPRDFLPTLDDPDTVSPQRVAAINEEMYGKFLVKPDRVIGVVVGGEARAYPISVMRWHEIANDTLGGEPILVTYSPLTDSVAAYRRVIDGRAVKFSHSGMVYHANTLLYDRTDPPRREGLWVQLTGEAIAGPPGEAGHQLEMLHVEIMSWGQWTSLHPQTDVVRGDPDYGADRYKNNPYAPYYVKGDVTFPAAPLPGAHPDLQTMSAVLAMKSPDGWRVAPFEGILYNTRQAQRWTGTVAGEKIELTFDTDAGTVWISEGPDWPTAYSRWFAWAAIHGDTRLIGGEPAEQ